jgi:hypothetical protein
MSSSKWLLVTAVIASVAYAWHQPRHAVGRETSGDDPDGFVAVATSTDAPSNTVVILAPRNCPSAQAKRADVMAEQLSQMGIPSTRLDHYSVRTPMSQPLMSNTNAVLGGKAPIVVINGMAKANPKVSEVAAEYQRSR